MKICIIGTGYVGLVTGTCFAEIGHDVTCVDKDAAKVKLLQNGGMPIYEPGLPELVQKNVAAGRLRFTASTPDGVEPAEVVFIAVPTPPQPDGSVDLSFIEGVAREIAACMTSYKIVVDKSTVPVRTGDKVAETIKRYCKAKVECDVVSNPEFLREGFAVDDFLKPDRVVIGCENVRVRILMEELYANFAKNGRPIITMATRSAEMTKYAANAMLATKISFMNEIARICERTGANVDDVRKGIGADSRIGTAFIYPGLGYGGSCFPKDTRALFKTALDHDVRDALGAEVLARGEAGLAGPDHQHLGLLDRHALTSSCPSRWRAASSGSFASR